MQATCIHAAAMLAALTLPTQVFGAAGDRRVRVEEARTLKEQLLDIAEERLAPAALFVDRRHSRLTLSAKPAPGTLDVRPLWPADAQPPALPLAFELCPVPESVSAPHTCAHAILAVTLLRDAAVAKRRVRRDAPMACDDVGIARLPLRALPKRPLALPCRMPAEVVALRDIAAGDALRADDVGAPFDVVAGMPVAMKVAVGGVTVHTAATAMADARAGELAQVRLTRPARTFRARVTGPGTVQLIEGGSP